MNEENFSDFCADILAWRKLDEGSGWIDDEGQTISPDDWKPYSSLDDINTVEQKVVGPKTKGGLGLGGRYFEALSKPVRHDLDYVEKGEAPDSGILEFTVTIYTDTLARIATCGISERREALTEIEDDIMRALKKQRHE